MGFLNLFGKKKEYELAQIYVDLRKQVLSLTKVNSLLKPPASLIAVLMETGYEEAVVTLVTVADGTVSLYFSNGGGMLGLGEHEEPRNACIDFLLLANQYVSKATSTSEFPVPSKGFTIFYFITTNGILSSTAKENDLGNNRVPLSPLFHKAHEVISQARMTHESIQRDIQQFIEAATNGNETKVLALLEAGRNPDVSDTSGLTPLMAAAYSSQLKILKLLLDRKSTIDQKDSSGYTAFMFACNAGKLDCAKLLAEHGAAINESDNDGSTPIMFAAQHGYNDIVVYLLDKGADPTITGKHGLSAIGFAKQNGLIETEKILLGKK